MRLRNNLAAVLAVLASIDSGIPIDFDAPTRTRRRALSPRRRAGGGVRDFAAIWIRDWMDGCVVSATLKGHDE